MGGSEPDLDSPANSERTRKLTAPLRYLYIAAYGRYKHHAGVVADERPGHVRLSSFFYNVTDDHVAAIEILRD